MTAVPATIVGMLQYKRHSTDEKSNPSERETLINSNTAVNYFSHGYLHFSLVEQDDNI